MRGSARESVMPALPPASDHKKIANFPRSRKKSFAGWVPASRL
jgi:hypothetical protein